MSNNPAAAVKSFLRGAKGIADAYLVVLKHLFRKNLTEPYPEFKRELPERTRARIVLTRTPSGDERCVACYLCSGACPVNCISMQSAEREDGRRHASWFRINFARCIYCGLCEEACPTLAIQLTPDFEFAKDDILKFVYEKEDLLINGGGKHPDYDFYAHCGVAFGAKKGGHAGERPPVDVKTNLP
jgi:NADH-quinone oxidoreductase subunit I